MHYVVDLKWVARFNSKGNNVILRHNRTLDLRVQPGGLAATEYLQHMLQVKI